MRAGSEVHLTPIEFDLVRVLAKHQGRLVTHGQLREVWGPEYGQETHYLRVHVAISVPSSSWTPHVRDI